MIIRTEYITTLLLIAVIVLAGCDTDKQQTPDQVEPPTDTSEDVVIPEVEFVPQEEKYDPIDVVYQRAVAMPHGAEATRDQLLAYVAAWEHIKQQLNAQNILITSDYRKTPFLTQAYIDIGEYDKAIENLKEQQKRIDALKAAGLETPNMYQGLLQGVSVEDIEAMKQRAQTQIEKVNVHKTSEGYILFEDFRGFIIQGEPKSTKPNYKGAEQ